MTTTTFPEAAKEFEANNKAIKIANSFFMLSPLVYLTVSVLELKFAFNKKRERNKSKINSYSKRGSFLSKKAKILKKNL